MADRLEFNSDYLNNYMEMVEDTESPRVFHLWSALWAVSTSLGRRCKINSGIITTLPNQYVLFVGTPGTRKSTAINIARKLLMESTGTRFAPSDTGFQRQGLVLAMYGGEDTDGKEFYDVAERVSAESSIASLTMLDDLTKPAEDAEDVRDTFVDSADKHHLAICASEFSRVIGQNNHSMLDFLGERYDGDPYEYHTRQTHIKMKHTLVNMAAASTPTSIAHSLPPQAGGQGFLSRIILVYGSKKYREIPWPEAPDHRLVAQVKDVLSDIYYKMSGEFHLTPGAKSLSSDLYHYSVEIEDSRFGYYSERRFAHLNKLAMALTASSGSMEIQPEHYTEAHRILRATEQGMPDALGEFGMNPLAQLKQDVLEQLRAQQGPLPLESVLAMFHRDARSAEIMEVISDLTKMNLATMTQLPTGSRVVSAQYRLNTTEDSMMSLLAEGK